MLTDEEREMLACAATPYDGSTDEASEHQRVVAGALISTDRCRFVWAAAPAPKGWWCEVEVLQATELGLAALRIDAIARGLNR